jgi:hypothetical protein
MRRDTKVKTKTLNTDRLEALLPAILAAWHEQEYPSILAALAKKQMDKKRPQELAFSLAENAANNWLEIYLRENHSAVACVEDRQLAQKELLKAVFEQYRLSNNGAARSLI